MSATETERLSALKAKTSALKNPWVSEIVLQTNQYDRMKLWYEGVLGGDWFVENLPESRLSDPTQHGASGGDRDKQVHAKDVRAAFMRLPTVDPYAIVFALFELPWLAHAPANDPGLNHMQMKHASLQALIDRIELLRDFGVDPHRAADHGPMTSFYFRDPDMNILELCVDNFSTPEEMTAIIQSPEFRDNPSGRDFDRDEYIARFRRGVPRDKLLSD